MLSIILTPTVYRYDAEKILADDLPLLTWFHLSCNGRRDGLRMIPINFLVYSSFTSISNLYCLAGIGVNSTLQKV